MRKLRIRRMGLLFGVISLSFLAVACKMRTDTTGVKKVKDNSLIQKAKGSSLNNKKEKGRKIYSIKDTFSNSKKDLKVKLDLTTHINMGKAYSVVGVKQRKVTQQEAKNFLDYFIGKEEFYRLSDQITKQDYITYRDDLKKNYDPMEESGIGEKTIGEEIALLNKEIKNAPDEVTEEIADRKLTENHGVSSIEGYVKNKDGRKKYLLIRNFRYKNQVSVTYTNFPKADDFAYYDMEGISCEKKRKQLPKITKKDAQEKAWEVLNALHMDGKDTYGIKSVKEAYSALDSDVLRDSSKKIPISYLVTFTRKVNGKASNLDGAFLAIDNLRHDRVYQAMTDKYSEADSSSTEEPWKLETISVLINDSGVIGFNWNSPCEEVETLVKDSKLMPFDQITKILRKMILLSNQPTEKGVSYELDCDKMTLGYERIIGKDDAKTALYVPAWKVWGNVKVDYKNEYDLPSLNMYQSILTINAVDGSIIEENKLADAVG
ncbi:hypothetical protein lbkm_4168 [Lachnospiraceae bacterium KM106-2]|nr:hypothetical protein lbkm_4168 [Lachnospiraceae bacterium KM106-2]